MKMLIGLLLILACMPLSASFDTKCSVLITLRLQSSEDAYKEALQKIPSNHQKKIKNLQNYPIKKNSTPFQQI